MPEKTPAKDSIGNARSCGKRLISAPGKAIMAMLPLREVNPNHEIFHA